MESCVNRSSGEKKKSKSTAVEKIMPLFFFFFCLVYFNPIANMYIMLAMTI